MDGDTCRRLVLLVAVLTVGAADHKDHSSHGNLHGDVTGEKHSGKANEHQVHTWTYNIEANLLGPDKWDTLFPEECGSVKVHQSPINIVTSKTTYSETLDAVDIVYAEPKVGPELEAGPTRKTEKEPEGEGEGKEREGEIKEHDNHESVMAEEEKMEADKSSSDSGMLIFNNGYAVQVDVKLPIYMMGAGLGNQYKVAQFHFHWGKNGSVGSEHRLNGEMFMLEMHIVTFNHERYSNLLEALGKEKGIAVFSTLFKRGKHNKHLNSVTNSLKNIALPETVEKVPIDFVDLQRVLPVRTDRYYRYQGSLTTPGCNEEVTWTVFADQPTICPSQMRKFYSVYEGYDAAGTLVALVNNWRPPQPLNERLVFSSFPAGSEHLVEYSITEDSTASTASSPCEVRAPGLVLAICWLCVLLRVAV